MRALLVWIFVAILAVGAPLVGSEGVAYAQTVYYVDCLGGDDEAPGTSPETAWRTLARANRAALEPGDQLRLKRGCDWNEQLVAGWAGTEDRPIVIGGYGEGERPSIHFAGDGASILVPASGTYQIIEDLMAYHLPADFPGFAEDCAGLPLGWRLGVAVSGSHNTLRNLLITENAMGVFLQDGSAHNRVSGSQIVRNTYAWARPPNMPHWFGGTGLYLHGDANEVDHNHFEGNIISGPCSQESIAIELYSATRSKIRHNVVIGDRVFIEMGSGGIISSDTLISDNVHVSTYNRTRFVVTRGVGQEFGPVTRTAVLNNRVYLPGTDGQGVVCSGCTSDILALHNNVIAAVNKAVYLCRSRGEPPAASHNVFWRTDGNVGNSQFLQCHVPDASSKVVDPQFADPANGDLSLRPGSPAIEVVTAVPSEEISLFAETEGVADDGALGDAASTVGAADPSDSDDPYALVYRLPAPGEEPVRIEAEHYKPGGQGVGYYDETPGNRQGGCRQEDVDLAISRDAEDRVRGCNIGFVLPGEWVAYDVFAPADQSYRIGIRIASAFNGSSIHVEIDGVNVTGSITAPNTGDWQKYVTVATDPISLSAGRHEVRLVFESQGVNINWFSFEAAPPGTH